MTLPARFQRAALMASVLLAAWAAVVWITGGVLLDVGGVRLSSRSPWRPAQLAAVLGVAALVTMAAGARRQVLARARRRGDLAAPWLAALLAVGVTASSALFGVHVAGGADASGYVSQSRLWAAGHPRVPVPELMPAEWPQRGWLVSPLGYAPSHVPGALGPTYAPGLPWLMAAGAAVAGEAGRYVWTPLFVGLLVWGTFLWARRDGPPLVALAAAVLVATSPPVLFAAMQTMSDLTAATLWLLSLLVLTSPARSGLASGALAGLALVVRPNLLFVAAGLWIADLAAHLLPASSAPHGVPAGGGAATGTVPANGTPPAPPATRARVLRAVQWAVPVATAALAIAAVNTTLWGSPTASGYGANEDLFRAGHVPGNLARLWRWTNETGGYWCLAGLVGLCWSAAGATRRRAWPAAALVAMVVVSYLVYAEFEEWWYLRFYLPAWPVLAAAAAVATWRVLARWSGDLAVLTVVVAALVFGNAGVRTAGAVGTFQLWKGEQRYAAVAAYVERVAPAGAVIVSVQHSGAIAYYTRHTIGRWDYIDPAGLDAFCARLAAAGRAVWLVADDWEEAPFRQRFTTGERGRLDWAPLAEARGGGGRVRIYDLVTPTRATSPALIPVAIAAPWPWLRLHRPPPAK